MKKRLTVITLLLMLCTTMFGQDAPAYPSEWGTISADSYNTTGFVSGTFKIRGSSPDATHNYVIGVFCGSELRSISQPRNGFFAINLRGNNSDIISFGIYDKNTQEAYYSNESVTLLNDMIMSNVILDFTRYFNYSKLDAHNDYSIMYYINASVKIDGKNLTGADYEFAAFDDEGNIRSEFAPINDSKINFNIRGKKDDNIIFKLYSHNDNKLYESEIKVLFKPDVLTYDQVINFMGEASFKVGENYFSTLQSAIGDNVGDNAERTVTLIRDAEGASVVIDRNVTIDFAGYTYTVNPPAATRSSDGVAFQINKVFIDGNANVVTLKNGTIKVAEGCEDFNTLVKNYADLTIEDMTFEGDNLDLGESSHVLSFVSGVAHVKRSTINANVVEGETHYSFGTTTEDGYSNPVVNLYLGNDYNTITGLVEYTGGSIIGNTDAGLEVVAKKSFDAVSGVEGSREGWGTISTPVYTEGTNGVDIPVSDDQDSPLANHDLYRYNEPTATWKFYKDGEFTPFTTFDLGQGYLYANTNDITLELQGKLAYGKKDVSFTISYTEEAGSLAGCNFIGNPFLHQISVDNIESETHIADGFYLVSTEGAFVPKDPKNTFVRPMESFLIQLKPKTTPSAKIGSFKTKVTIHPTPITKERSSEVNGSLAINVSNEKYSDVAYVSFSENIGLTKVAHYNDEIPMVYVTVDGEDFAIAMMSQDVTEIPVSFKAATMGEYTIGVEARDCEYSTMTLVDRMTGIETNLLLEDYTFLAKSGDNTGRFIIKLANDANNDTDNSNFAYINNGMMFVNNIAGQGVINIYDVTGRPVAEYNVAESATISTTDFAAGMYIIRMSDENGVKVQKIVVE